jgi:hypothetical protein
VYFLWDLSGFALRMRPSISSQNESVAAPLPCRIRLVRLGLRRLEPLLRRWIPWDGVDIGYGGEESRHADVRAGVEDSLKPKRLMLKVFTYALEEPLSQLQTDAAVFRKRGFEAHANLIESVVEDVRAAMFSFATRTLSVREAADLFGYTESHLYSLVREGRIENLAQDRQPMRLRLGELLTLRGGGDKEESDFGTEPRSHAAKDGTRTAGHRTVLD